MLRAVRQRAGVFNSPDFSSGSPDARVNRRAGYRRGPGVGPLRPEGVLKRTSQVPAVKAYWNVLRAAGRPAGPA